MKIAPACSIRFFKPNTSKDKSGEEHPSRHWSINYNSSQSAAQILTVGKSCKETGTLKPIEPAAMD